MKLSGNEKQVLDQLKINGRMTATEISKQTGIPRTTVNTIINRLDNTVIESYSLKLQDSYTSSHVSCYVMITRDPKVEKEVANELQNIPEIKFVNTVTGPFDLVALITAENHANMDRLLNKIAKLDGIIKTETYVILSNKFSR